MSVSEHAHPIPGGAAELEEAAQRLFGKPYTRLSDDEADAVWQDIGIREEEGNE